MTQVSHAAYQTNVLKSRISVDASWQETYQSKRLGKANTMLPRHVSNSTTWGVIDVYVFGSCGNMIYNDVIWPIKRSPVNSCTLFIAKLHLNRKRLLEFSFMSKRKYIDTFTILKWHYIGHEIIFKQYHNSTTKGHRKLSMDKFYVLVFF